MKEKQQFRVNCYWLWLGRFFILIPIARALYTFLFTHIHDKKIGKMLMYFGSKSKKTQLVKIKSAQYHAKGYEYHFPIQIVAEAVVIVIICRQNFASTKSVMLCRFYAIMETNKFRVMCV